MGLLDKIIDGYQTGMEMLAPTDRDLEMRAKMARGLLDFTPVAGGIMGMVDNAREGNPGMAAMNAATVPVDLATMGGGAAIKGGLLGMAIDPAGKSRLIADLIAGMGSGSYKLGDVTQGQLKGLSQAFGRAPAGPDVMMNNRTLNHLIEARLARDGFSPEEVGKFATQAMQPRADAMLDIAKSQQNPALVNRGLLDAGSRYDARMPLGLTDNGEMFVRSIIPEGLKKKGPVK